MPSFGKISKERLASCHHTLQEVFNLVIQQMDISVVHGFRSPEVQFNLYKKGRKFVDGKWEIVNKSDVVTYKDGYIKKSKHNESPSMAVDVVPYFKDKPHIRWDDLESFVKLNEVVESVCDELGVKITWGGYWQMKDYPHYQIDR